MSIFWNAATAHENDDNASDLRLSVTREKFHVAFSISATIACTGWTSPKIKGMLGRNIHSETKVDIRKSFYNKIMNQASIIKEANNRTLIFTFRTLTSYGRG